MSEQIKVNHDYDLICIGGGIMSSTLAVLSKLLNPELKILILEKMDAVALESSAAWNNAGTGHSALCELNYTPEAPDGNIDIRKAVDICAQFEMSKQFWSFLVEQGLIEDPTSFVKPVPHHSWVTGAKNAEYLEKRYHTMREHFMFDNMEFTRDATRMKEWFPLIANNRSPNEIMAASRIERGTEINFGALTRQLCQLLETHFNTPIQYYKEVVDIDPDADTEWSVKVEDTRTGELGYLDAKHVFIGAGGGSLLLLQHVEIDEKEGFGGFPVSGAWLVCKNQNIIDQHHAKVYSKAGLGDPPMSVPHLDTRFIDGKRELLFGPFAGFSPKFLKEGSNLDLFKSIRLDNIQAMLGAFWHNLPLTEYLVKQLAMTFDDRMDELRNFIKDARNEDWEIRVAGQRVQIIKEDEYQGGKLQFGTEIISSTNGSITCLLGASPGASTAVSIMLEVLEKAFPEITNSEAGAKTLKKIVPFWKEEVTKNNFDQTLSKSAELLQLKPG